MIRLIVTRPCVAAALLVLTTLPAPPPGAGLLVASRQAPRQRSGPGLPAAGRDAHSAPNPAGRHQRATVERVQGDWVQITFNDPQLGRRTGWVQRNS